MRSGFVLALLLAHAGFAWGQGPKVDAVSGAVLEPVGRAPAVAGDDAPTEAAGVESIEAAPAGDDEIIVVDDDAADEEIVLGDDTGAPAPLAAAPVERTHTWAKVEVSSRVMVDTAFDGHGEHVLEWWNLGRLRLDYRQSSSLKAVVEGWLRWGVAAKRHLARDPKWTGQVELREGYLAWRRGKLDLKVGQRIYVWGKNELLPPADVLNPLDLRFDAAAFVTNPKDAKRPVFSLEAGYYVDDWGLQLVVLPFFAGHRAFLVGRDFALAPPGSDLEGQIQSAGALHPSIEDELQGEVVGTELPEEAPWGASVALRATGRVAGWDVGLTAFNGWDRTPRLFIDPDALTLLESSDRILAQPDLMVTDPELRDASLGVQEKAAVGQQLVRATYGRAWIFAGEAQTVLGDLVVRADLGFSPAQLFYTSELDPLRLANLRGVLGVEYTRGEAWYVALTGFATGVLHPPAGALLLGIDNSDAQVGARTFALGYGSAATVRWRDSDLDLDATATALYTFEPGDYLASGSVGYVFAEPHSVRLGALIVGGKRGSLGRQFDGNDLVFLEYRAAF